MSCYHPITAFYNSVEKTPILFSAPKVGTKEALNWKCINVPCGHCIGCRLDHAREWVCRLLMEWKTNPQGVFLTLTYDEAHCPYQLEKSDLQKFFKRLRKEYKNVSFKYYACGEYGPKTLRPHYHVVLFGYDFMDKNLKHIDKAYYRHKLVERIRGKGNVMLSFLTSDNIGYATRYTLKKANCNDAKMLTDLGLSKEFQLSSTRLGLNYFKVHKDEILSNNFKVNFSGQSYNLPRYFFQFYNEEDLEKMHIYRNKVGHNFITALNNPDLDKLEMDKLRTIQTLKHLFNG